MTPDELQRLLKRQPFPPIRLHIGNGRTLDVRHPEMAIVGEEVVAIGAEEKGAKWPQLRVLSLININEVEFLPAASA